MISVLWFVKYHEKINLEIKTSISHFNLTDGVVVIILQLLILCFCVYHTIPGKRLVQQEWILAWIFFIPKLRDVCFCLFFIFNYSIKWKEWPHRFLFVLNRKSNWTTNTISNLATLTPYICHLQFFSFHKKWPYISKKIFQCIF